MKTLLLALVIAALCVPLTGAVAHADSGTGGSHGTQPHLIILSVSVAPYVAPPAMHPLDNPNYAYSIQAPTIQGHSGTTALVTFNWCNNRIPAPYSHLRDAGTGSTWDNSLPVTPNSCQSVQAIYLGLQPGHVYNVDECEAYHGNCGGITPWIQG